MPVIPFGAGSSLEGHVLPVHGGAVARPHRRWTAVLEVNAEDLDCRVQAGVLRLALEKRLGQDGLFFAVDPGADATLGGMAATAASGHPHDALRHDARERARPARPCSPTGP